MNWFSRKPTQQKYVNAAITVATNLYLDTIPGSEDTSAPLDFRLQDSRYRYLIFYLGATVTVSLAYDEKKRIQPELLINGCLSFARWAGTENAKEYFNDPNVSQDSVGRTTSYFQEFLKQWSQWPELERKGKNAEIIDLICTMIHTTESNEVLKQGDKQRLDPLALQIDCRLLTMRSAFMELANR
jgi:hypothetical protein